MRCRLCQGFSVPCLLVCENPSPLKAQASRTQRNKMPTPLPLYFPGQELGLEASGCAEPLARLLGLPQYRGGNLRALKWLRGVSRRTSVILPLHVLAGRRVSPLEPPLPTCEKRRREMFEFLHPTQVELRV